MPPPAPAHGLHHVELYVEDLAAAEQFWSGLFPQLGFEAYQRWDDGFSWVSGSHYIVFVATDKGGGGFNRRAPGLNHLAFWLPSRKQVDRLTEGLRASGTRILYEDRHPFAGGPEHYAVFFEDPMKLKVEVVASAEGHRSATPDHYDLQAKDYDRLNEERSVPLNAQVECTLQTHQARTVLDMSCGTGSQLFWLAEKGLSVTGLDLSPRMLAQAQARADRAGIELRIGDIRSTRVGQFDAVLSMFNAVGHLTRPDFQKALDNIRHNLKPNGIYIFDIFDAAALRFEDRVSELTIDWIEETENTQVRKIQYSTIDIDGILTSHTTHLRQDEGAAPRVAQECQTLQTYCAPELVTMLTAAGFETLQQTGVDGATGVDPFRIMTVARKT